MERVSLPRAKGVRVQTTEDGKHTAVCFTIQDGVTGAVLENSELSRLSALLLNQSQKVAGRVTPETPPERFTATPIMASHVSFGDGRSDTEAAIAFKVGNMMLTFAVDLSMLHKQCRLLLAATNVKGDGARAN